MEEPHHWGQIKYDPIDYQASRYFSAPKKKAEFESLDEIDPEILATFEKLGIPLDEQKRLSGVAVDAVFDSVSVATTHQDVLAKKGVIFCSFSEAVKNHPELVKKYLGSVVPANDNFFAALNSAVFSDGSFAYIPKGVKCPMDLSTYFRINAKETGQFERTLIIAEEGASAPPAGPSPGFQGVRDVDSLAGRDTISFTVEADSDGPGEFRETCRTGHVKHSLEMSSPIGTSCRPLNSPRKQGAIQTRHQ